MSEASVVLCILDGWGCADDGDDNAIARAQTPNWDAMLAKYPHSRLETSGHDVGLPDGQMGNSEVGHMNIGCGRIVMQELPRIDSAIADGSLAEHQILRSLIAKLKASGKACHIMGLLSDGGVHSHQQHIFALARMVAAAGVPVWIHAFLDGRDTPPRSAENYLIQLEEITRSNAIIKTATISGRYYAMDRDKRWDRVEKAYSAIVMADGDKALSALSALSVSYEAGINDEFVLPVVIGDYKGMMDGDAIIMANFRADRVRQLSHALLDDAFDGFARKRQIKFAATVAMTEYSSALSKFYEVLFPPQNLENGLGEIVAQAGYKQLRIAETEKYAHVTFFFNGGKEDVFAGEDRILVPSPKVATYDLQPEMSAYELTDQLVAAIESNKYRLIVANYANTDMVGHTGNQLAAQQAVEAVDKCLGRLLMAVEKTGAVLCVSADHGNAEQMHDHETAQAHTAHTLNAVPFVVAVNSIEKKRNLKDGRLADIAPTLLELMGLQKPLEMTGKSLFSLLLLLLFSAAPLYAETEDELEQIQQKIEEAEIKQQKIASKTGVVEKELLSLQQEMVKLAAKLKATEQSLTRKEFELAEIVKKLRQSQQQLEARRSAIANQILAMTKLSRIPPEAWMAMPGSIEQGMRAALALKYLTTSLHEQAKILLQDIAGLEELRLESEKLRNQLKEEQKNLADARGQLEEKMRQRKKIHADLGQDMEKTRREVTDLSERASNLQELLEKIEKQRRDYPTAQQRKSYEGKDNVAGSKGKFALPVDGEIVKKFGDNSKGIEIKTRAQAQVVSPFDGEVVYTGPFLSYGNIMIIRHGEQYHSLLAGLKSTESRVGDNVLKGEPVGRMGREKDGLTKLYIELRKNSKPIDPAPWFSG